MAITINGSGTIGGISVGGLNDGIITQPELAAGVAGTGPAFSAYYNTGTTNVSNNTSLKVPLNAEEYDTANCFDSTTNYRFTPNVAGYYLISGTSWYNGSNVNGEVQSAIYKNGSSYKASTATYGATYGHAGATVTALVYLNGSTDYVELYTYQITGATQPVNSGSTLTYMTGFLARAA